MQNLSNSKKFFLKHVYFVSSIPRVHKMQKVKQGGMVHINYNACIIIIIYKCVYTCTYILGRRKLEFFVMFHENFRFTNFREILTFVDRGCFGEKSCRWPFKRTKYPKNTLKIHEISWIFSFLFVRNCSISLKIEGFLGNLKEFW